ALAHRGRLVCGELSGVPVVMMQGRCHGYEGYSVDELMFPVRVLAALGVTTLVVTNASGGLNPQFAMGDIMLIDDHINLMWIATTVGHDGCAIGRVSRPHSSLYDRDLGERACKAAWKSGFALQRGTYVAVTGPSYETRA